MKIASAAKLDLKEAQKWYNDQVPGLGDDFIHKVDDGLEYLVKNPKKLQIRYEDLRLHLVKGFPYGIHFYIEKDMVVVTAVIHLSREPRSWKSRI